MVSTWQLSQTSFDRFSRHWTKPAAGVTGARGYGTGLDAPGLLDALAATDPEPVHAEVRSVVQQIPDLVVSHRSRGKRQRQPLIGYKSQT